MSDYRKRQVKDASIVARSRICEAYEVIADVAIKFGIPLDKPIHKALSHLTESMCALNEWVNEEVMEEQ